MQPKIQNFLRSRLLTAHTADNAKQAIETGLTGIICLYIAKSLGLPQSYWAVISALIVRQADTRATFGASWTRLAGTAVGAIVGGAFANFWGSQPWAFAIATSVAVLACLGLKLSESYRLSTITVAVVMLIGHAGTSPWIVALDRFLEVALGAVIAVLLTFLFERIW